MKQRSLFNIYLALTAGMLSGARRVAMMLLLTLLTAATAWADDLATFTLAEKMNNGKDWPAGTKVGVVQTADTDDPLSCTVTTDGVPFKFKKGTNQLIVTDGSLLDYETKEIWTFNVSATDGEQSFTMEVTVNLTDVNEAPVIEDVEKVYSVDENTATGIAFGSFTVFDPDAGDKLTYTLTGALTGAAGISGTLKNKTLADIFYVDESANSSGKRTASIRVKNKGLLDYEELYKASSKNASYPVTITITDKASNSVDVTTKITVQDVNEDLTATGGTFYIQEHSPGLSHVCTTKYNDYPDEAYYGKVAGSDKDKYNKSFGTLTYSISTRNTGTKLTDSKSFVVDPDDGSIFTAANAEFEYDGDAAKRSYTFLVGVSDGEFSKDVEVTVKVLDITEPPINLVTEGSGRIREDATKGTSAASFSKDFITDPDELAKFEAMGDDVRFTIDQNASDFGAFKAVETTGDIYLDDPTKIDFETLYSKNKTVLSVVMTATNIYESNSPTLTITRNIEVVDVNEPPTASDLTKTVDENIAGGTVIGTIEASDPDTHASCNAGSHSCGFNTLHYSIVDASGLPFEIEEATGKIKLKKNERLRYSEKKQYKFDVKVSDRAKSDPALSTFAHVTINVIDDNEPSEFVTLGDVFEVEENVETGTKLEGDAIVVLDDDQADADNLNITITDNDATDARDAADLFEVVQVGTTDANTHKSTFAIQTKADLDYESLFVASEKDAVFNVMLTITDRAANTISQDTKIRVIDVNEEPAFTMTACTFHVSENVAKETALEVAKAMDPDIYNAKFGTLYFSLEGDDAAPFDIDGGTGEILVPKSAKLDYESKKIYEFYAVVTDKKYTKKIPVTVNITNMDETPVFHNVPELHVDENSEIGANVGVVTADDDDCKNNHIGMMPTYSLVATDDAANDYKSFTIDHNTGTIKVNARFDYETKNIYYVRIVATDGSDPTLTNYADVVIYIDDVNEAPSFKYKSNVITIAKGAAVSTEAITYEDLDKYATGEFLNNELVITGGPSDLFEITADGFVKPKDGAVINEAGEYKLDVTVRDANRDGNGDLLYPDFYEEKTFTLRYYAAGVDYMDWDDTEKILVKKNTATDDNTANDKVWILSGAETKLGANNSETWYVVPTNGVSYSSPLFLKGDVHLILTDGATMKHQIESLRQSEILTIHGQTEGTGKLTGDRLSINGDITINGGIIEIYGGQGAIRSPDNIIINGGQVTATGSDHGIWLEESNKIIVLRWTKASDFIQASSYYFQQPGCVMNIPAGKFFLVDGTTTVFGSATADYVFTDEELTAIAGKKLIPALPIATGGVDYLAFANGFGNWKLLGDDAQVYAVTGYDLTAGQVYLKPIADNVVPKGIPVVIGNKTEGAALPGDICLVGSDAQTTTVEGLLKGFVACDGSKSVQDYLEESFGEGVSASDYIPYLLKDNMFKIVLVSASDVIKKDICLLFIPKLDLLVGKSVGTTNAARSIAFGGGEATGIENVQSSMLNVQSDSWYDLQGRRLSGRPTKKGLYLFNGKKVVF